MFKRLVSAAVLFGMAATAPPAFAANCAMRDMVIDRLESKYSEQFTAGGLQTSRTTTSFVEVWSSPETGTFTVMLTNPKGISCIVATGTDWFQQEPEAQPAGSAS